MTESLSSDNFSCVAIGKNKVSCKRNIKCLKFGGILEVAPSHKKNGKERTTGLEERKGEEGRGRDKKGEEERGRERKGEQGRREGKKEIKLDFPLTSIIHGKQNLVVESYSV